MKNKLLHSFRLRATMLVAMMLCVVNAAWAGEETITFSDKYSSNTVVDGTPINGTYFSVTFNKRDGGTDTQYYTNGSAVRWYGGGTLVVSSTNTITKIEITFTQTANTVSANSGTYESGTWTGSANSVTFSQSGTTGQCRISAIKVTFSAGGSSAYTITAGSNNTSYGTVSLSGSVITANPASGYTYADPAYTVSPANSATVAQNGNAFTVTPSANTTVTINFEAIPTYTVTYSDGGSVTEATGGAGVTLATRSGIGDYTFAGWSETEVSSETTTAPTIISTSETYYPTDNITLYPVYTKKGEGAAPSAFSVGNTGEYAIVSAEQNGKYYALPTQPTVSNGKITAQEITVSETTDHVKYISSTNSAGFTWTIAAATNGYTLSDGNKYIYHSNGGASGTNVTYGTSTSYTWSFTEDGDYITMAGMSGTTTNNRGMLFNGTTIGGYALSNATSSGYYKIMILPIAASSTSYYWSTPSGTQHVAQPVITIENGPFVSSKLVTITTETEGAAIQYSTDGGTNWTSYSAPFSISATTTVQAKATKSGMDDSYVAEATFTKETVLEGLVALADQTNTSNATYYVSLTNAQVTYVTGNNGFMEDATAGIYVYNASPVLNKVYNGIFQVTYQLYNHLPELKAITAVDGEGTVSDGSTKAATEVELSTLTENWTANLGRKVQVRATLTSTGDLADGYSLYKYDNTITTEGLKTYTLVGYPYIHSNSPQFNIISAEEVQLQDNSIIMVGPDYTIDVSGTGAGSVNMTSAAASHGTLQSEVVLASTTVDASKYTFAGNVLTVHDVTEGGVIVIRYWVEADTEYNAAELLVPIYLKATPIIAYDGVTESTAYGTPYTIDTYLIQGGDITVSSGNTAVATVDGLTITPVAVGSTTITINTADANIWHAGEATFTLNVRAPEGKTTAPNSEETVFNETFAECAATGGNSEGFAAASTTAISDPDNYTDNNGWEFTYGYPADACVKFGGSSKKGQADSPNITVENGKTYTLTFKAAPWNVEADKTMTISVTGGTINSESSATTSSMTVGEWNEFEYEIVASSASLKLSFTCSANRFFLDEVKLTKSSEAPSITATLSSTTGYATFCSEYPLDFSDDSEFSAWEITGISGSEITFNQITGTVKGGTGVFLKGTAGETVTLTSADSNNTLSDNLLEGIMAPTYVAAGDFFGLKGNEFVPVNAGTIPAGKALLPATEVPNNVKAFTFVFVNTATGVRTVETVSAEDAKAIFNLAGQRLSKTQRGINIVNGKKVVVK